MSDVDEILSSLPIDKIAAQIGEDPEAVEDAAAAAVPALLGGLDANAGDPAGAASLLEAIGQHADKSIDPSDVDAADGEKAAAHIFGGNQEQVVNQLAGTGVSSTLVKKLLPILAPIVLSWLAKRVLGGKGGAAAPSADGGGLGGILGEVLKGAVQGGGGGRGSVPNAGSIISDVLGGLLGGGRR
ncbi:DUF937 domain-containing protein [Nocardioides speluncae]|uniref:DUF937 domain-containing protein n=1 Tax=Nocardioides speluncae TaxID=2670337 RepID=UPI000D69DB19|nr:DUF937 domain-containing protein [Nocardioides speluncae]